VSKKFLIVPFSVLWVSIVALRVLLTREVLGHLLPARWFDLVFFLFVASISGVEIAILLRARSSYSGLPEPTMSTDDQLVWNGKPRGTVLIKIVILLFLCSMPLALWHSRNASIGIALPALLAGGGFNLSMTAGLANAVLAARNRTRRAKPA